MAYGSAMNLNQMGSYGVAGTANYGAASSSYASYPANYCPPGPSSFPFSAGPAATVQTTSQMLQAFVSLQSNWSQFLGANPQLTQDYYPPQAAYPQYAMPSYSTYASSNYDTYASAYQQYLACMPPAPTPAYEAPAPTVNVAAAVNVDAPPATVAVASSAGGDGGGSGSGDGGDPVILDLNGDNKLDTTGANGSKINFNLFGNGTNVKTEWLKAGSADGLLVSDFNGDGKIDSGRELMRTTGVNGEQGKYKGGWDKLSQLFDKNMDGKVSGDELNQLKVWVDKDGDGVSEEGELRSVKELGISQIDIPGDGVKSNFTMNGKKQMAEDYVFDLAK